MKMFFNIQKRNNYINNTKQPVNNRMKTKTIQKKRNVSSIFSLNSIINTKYASRCGSCG